MELLARPGGLSSKVPTTGLPADGTRCTIEDMTATTTPDRFARIASTSSAIASYLPSNYEVARITADFTYLRGTDVAGWTLDGYVLPRLASGLYFGTEIDVRDFVMALGGQEVSR